MCLFLYRRSVSWVEGSQSIRPRRFPVLMMAEAHITTPPTPPTTPCMVDSRPSQIPATALIRYLCIPQGSARKCQVEMCITSSGRTTYRIFLQVLNFGETLRITYTIFLCSYQHGPVAQVNTRNLPHQIIVHKRNGAKVCGRFFWNNFKSASKFPASSEMAV